MRLDDVLKSERLMFVCHSMGGIVVRKFLVERAIELIERETEIGLFLVASPSLGSDYANWLSPLARLFGHAQADVLRFVRGNYWLQDLDKEFTNLKEAGKLRIRGKELVEDKFVLLKKLLWKKQVVEPFAGAKYFGEPFKVPKSDHFSIAKPEDSNAIQHRLLCGFIKDVLGLSTPPPPREPEGLPPVPKVATVNAPEIVLDWPYSELPHEEVCAFLAEAEYRAERHQNPWFRVSLFSLQVAKAGLSEIEQRGARTAEDRAKRIELLQSLEYLKSIQTHLTNCLTLVISEELRRQVGWGLMSKENMALVITEFLHKPNERNVRALLINHTAKLQARLYVERHRLEKIFGCRLSEASDTFLSVIDCPLPEEVAKADWETMWRAFGAILRTAVERGIDPIDNTEAIHMRYWVLSGD
jgi:hypothetical protein